MSRVFNLTGELVDVDDYELPNYLCINGENLREEILQNLRPKSWKNTKVERTINYGRVRITVVLLNEEEE